MRLVVFGATGGTGRQLVERGLSRGHEIIAAVRRPEAVTTRHDQLRVMKCNVLDPAAVRSVLSGADAALCAIGPANNRNPGTLISEGVANIVQGCSNQGVKRFVFESGLMVGDGSGLSLLGRLGVSIFRAINRKLCEDKRIAEATIQKSGLDWVIVRPPTLADLPASGDYKFGTNIRLNAAKKLAHTDVADFMIKLAMSTEHNRTVLDVGH